MRGAGKAKVRRRGRPVARPGLRATFALWLAMFALVGQIFAAPLHNMPASTEVEAGLTALFGDAAALCVHDDGDTGSGDHHRPCDECCPLCQVGAGALALLLPPAPAAMPIRVDHGAEPIPPPTVITAPKPSPNALAQARAPPFEA